MPSTLNNWNPNDRAACFRQFAEGLVAQSKAIFLADRCHGEMFFFVTPNGEALVIPAPPKMDRDELVVNVRQTVQQQDIYGVVHIVEGWTYFAQRPHDHTITQIIEGEIRVSELRPEDRTEALIVMMESREGAHFLWLTPILRDEETVTLGETVEYPDPPNGRFSKLFGGES